MTNKSHSKHYVELFDGTGELVRRIKGPNAESGLRGAALSGFAGPLAQMQGLDLSGANLYWASLTDADLSFAQLAQADLRGANLSRAICRGTIFRGANLGRDNLGGRTLLCGADLSSATLGDANLQDAVFDETTKFPPGFSPSERGMSDINSLPTNDPARIPRGSR